MTLILTYSSAPHTEVHSVGLGLLYQVPHVHLLQGRLCHTRQTSIFSNLSHFYLLWIVSPGEQNPMDIRSVESLNHRVEGEIHFFLSVSFVLKCCGLQELWEQANRSCDTYLVHNRSSKCLIDIKLKKFYYSL